MVDNVNSRDCCPVCNTFDVIIGDDYAYCIKCGWGEKSYQLETVFEGTENAVSDAVDRIVDYLMANECVVSMENLSIRFSQVVGLDTIIEGMKVRQLIDVIKVADGEKHVVLLTLPVKTCKWADVTVMFDTEDSTRVQHYRIHCKLTKEQQTELIQDVQSFVADWITDEQSD